jgi:hypothetical protein
MFPDKRKLIGLVEQAYQGKICLPDFQRDFVWTREGVADLLRSVLRAITLGRFCCCGAIRKGRLLRLCFFGELSRFTTSRDRSFLCLMANSG